MENPSTFVQSSPYMLKKQAVFINLVYISGYASVEFKRYTIT